MTFHCLLAPNWVVSYRSRSLFWDLEKPMIFTFTKNARKSLIKAIHVLSNFIKLTENLLVQFLKRIGLKFSELLPTKQFPLGISCKLRLTFNDCEVKFCKFAHGHLHFALILDCPGWNYIIDQVINVLLIYSSATIFLNTRANHISSLLRMLSSLE